MQTAKIKWRALPLESVGYGMGLSVFFKKLVHPVNVLQNIDRIEIDDFALFGQFDTARAAGEKNSVKLSFELLDGFADIWLAGVESAGGLAERTGAGTFYEIL